MPAETPASEVPAVVAALAEDPPGLDDGELRLLAAALVHDARNPLNAVVLQVELLSMMVAAGKATPAQLTRGLETIGREVHRSNELFGRYLDAVQADWGPPAEMPLWPSVRAAADDVQNELTTRGVDLDLALPGTLPEIVGKPELVRLAVRAALRGALAALPGSAAGTLRIEAGPAPDLGEVALTLTIPGASSTDAASGNLFRLSEKSRAAVALAISKQAALSSGGAASASNVTEGLRLRLSWPIAGSLDDDPELAPGPGKPLPDDIPPAPRRTRRGR
jgi:signal transduction histidine kinase